MRVLRALVLVPLALAGLVVLMVSILVRGAVMAVCILAMFALELPGVLRGHDDDREPAGAHEVEW